MEAHVCGFQRNLMEFVALTASVRDDLQGDCLPAFDDQLRQRAAPICDEWLRTAIGIFAQNISETSTVSFHMCKISGILRWPLFLELCDCPSPGNWQDKHLQALLFF
eukprot:Skav217539  [mRNA]  locus=scaffold467:240809:242361:+ [translate_table: standard]